jgi:Protein of unknown function (DUF2924)
MLTGRMMACRLQEQAFGSLDRESLRFLEGLARHGGASRRQLKPGTALVRDYQGQRHTVTVAADGFNYAATVSLISRSYTHAAHRYLCHRSSDHSSDSLQGRCVVLRASLLLEGDTVAALVPDRGCGLGQRHHLAASQQPA